MIARTISRLIMTVFVCMAAGTASAQEQHNHHHQAARDDETAAEADTSVWRELDERLRLQFDSAYTSVLRNPSELGTVYSAYLDRIPVKAILQYLETRHTYCHPLAHDLGASVYRHFQSLGTAIHECGDGCSSACMHGAVREAFGDATVEDIVAGVDSVCAIDGMAEINRPGNCAHALGHALMMSTGDSLRASLEGCSAFPGRVLQHYCGTGVFMEFGADRISLDREPPPGEIVSRHPCDEFPEFAAACYRYVVPRMRRVLDTSEPGVLAAECRKLPPGEQLGCFRGLGVAFAGTVRRTPERIHDVCRDGDPDNELVCIDALVEQTAYSRPEEARAICAELDGRALEVCTAALTGRYELYKPIMDVYLGSGF